MISNTNCIMNNAETILLRFDSYLYFRNLTKSSYMIPSTNKSFLVISSQDIRTVRISEDSRWNTPLFYLKVDSHLTYTHDTMMQLFKLPAFDQLPHQLSQQSIKEWASRSKSYWDCVIYNYHVTAITIMKSNTTGFNYNLFVPVIL